jgi:hypothetical protein
MKKSNHLSKFNMKKVIKSGIVVMLSAVIIMSQVAPMSFADNDNGNRKQNIEKKSNEHKNDDKKMDKKEYDPKLKAELREKLQTMYRFGDDGMWANLPSGMFKQGYLNYGLAKRYFNGQFPYGLAKKLKDFNYDDHHAVQNIEDLKKLIVSAKTKLEPANTKVYTADAKTLLQAAITKAEAFVAAYVPTQEKDIKVQYEALKKAMVAFDNSEIVSGTYITDLNALLTKLNLYKTTYYSKLTDEKKASLDALIAKVVSYTTAVPVKVLTLGAYNEMMMEAKKFEDHINKLDTLIAEIQAFLYVDPNAAIKVRKVVEGTAEGNYAAGSIAKIEAAVLVAKTFSDSYANESAGQIDAQYNTLNKAFTTFKDSVVLGTVHLDTLKLLRDELLVYYNLNVVPVTKPLTELVALIAEMNPIIATPSVNPLTKAKLAYFMDASKNYIKDLYDPLKVELSAKIVAANAVWAVEAKAAAVDEKAALLTTITAAQAYLAGSTHTYANFYVHINALQAAMTAYINANL